MLAIGGSGTWKRWKTWTPGFDGAVCGVQAGFSLLPVASASASDIQFQ